MSAHRISRLPSFLRGRLLAVLTLGYIAGLLLGAKLSLPVMLTGILALALLGLAILIRAYTRAAIALSLGAMIILGCSMYNRAYTAANSFPLQGEEEAQITGIAQANSVNVAENRQRLQIRTITVNGREWRGQIYVYYEGNPLLKGAAVGLRGQVMSFSPYGNPGSFDYNAYIKRQGIAAAVSCYYGGELISSAGESSRGNVRTRLLSAFDAVAKDRAGLLAGVFLGDKSDLSFAQKSALTYSGMMHAFSVSGLHVGYLVAAALLIGGSGRKRRWLRLGLVGLMLLFYLNLTGMSPPIVRAALMALCLLIAAAADEKNDAYTSLSLAALLCLIYRPLWLLDAGFLLSFAAALGLIYLMQPMKALLGHKQGFFADAMAVTLAASFATMPLISYYFYNISLVSWILSIPFAIGTGVAVICCFIASLLAVFSSIAAQLPLYVADLIMNFLFRLSDYGSSLPGAYISSGHTPAWAVAIFYLLLILAPPLCSKLPYRRLAFGCTLVLLIISLSCSAPLAHKLSRPDGYRLEVVFLDVGQGDAALIITPQGKTILVDGGGNRFSPGSVGENVLIPYLRYRGLQGVDMVVSSHPDDDHIDGLLTVMQNLPVGRVMYGDVFADSEEHLRLLRLAEENGAILTPVYSGQRYNVEDDVTIQIYHPPQNIMYTAGQSNDGSLTMVLSYGRVDFLFTGDVVLEAMETIPQAEIVKLPHHGSKYNYDEYAYRQFNAQAVILSAGRDNSYGHPAPEVLAYWQDKAQIFRTDTQGAITIFSNGLDWQAVTYW